MKNKNIKIIRKNGFIKKIINSKGKGSADIVQRVRGGTGFTVVVPYKKNNKTHYRKIAFSRTESGAIKAAIKKGKKTITFKD